MWRSIYFSGYHLFKGNACERFTCDIDFFMGKSSVKTEKSKPTLFVDLSVHDVESKNASSINVTLSLFLFSQPLAIKFNCFVLKYLLNIKIYWQLFNSNCLIWLIFCLCSNLSTKGSIFVSCHTIAFVFSSTFLPKRDPLKIFQWNNVMKWWYSDVVILS